MIDCVLFCAALLCVSPVCASNGRSLKTIRTFLLKQMCLSHTVDIHSETRCNPMKLVQNRQNGTLLRMKLFSLKNGESRLVSQNSDEFTFYLEDDPSKVCACAIYDVSYQNKQNINGCKLFCDTWAMEKANKYFPIVINSTHRCYFLHIFVPKRRITHMISTPKKRRRNQRNPQLRSDSLNVCLLGAPPPRTSIR